MKKLYALIYLFIISNAALAQVTTSGVSGKIIDTKGVVIVGATVELINENNGSHYGSISNSQGLYRIPNVEPGDNYKIVISCIGYDDNIKTNMYLRLGDIYVYNVALEPTVLRINDILVKGEAENVFAGNRMDAKTIITNKQSNRIPSLSRGIGDYVRMTPQISINPETGAISAGGQNNRYNAFTVDGTPQSDIFGLSNSGTNGGQIDISPISMETIKQLSISLSPYDVKQSGFSGAAINAVTRNGTNRFTVSAYSYLRNDNLAGKTPYNSEFPDAERNKLPNFISNTYGASVGGAIIKNKLFYFFNAEVQRDESPYKFGISTFSGATIGQIEQLVQKLQSQEMGYYNPGSATDNGMTRDAYKFFGRIDWNVSKIHKLSIRNNTSYGRRISSPQSTPTRLYFNNNGQDFKSLTNTTTLELLSNYSPSMSNRLYFAANIVEDDRNPRGANYPSVQIRTEGGGIYFGSGAFDCATLLTQRLFTISDNIELNFGKHTFTFGTHNEFFMANNVFIRDNFGSYIFSDYETFMNNGMAESFTRNYSKIPEERGLIGDKTAAAAKFNTLQLGFYIQDEFRVNTNLTITYGIRLDVPIFLTKATENSKFNTQSKESLIMAGWGDVLGDAEVGKMPKPQFMFSPRVGFNWDVTGEKQFQIRGGIGIFTNRIPYVYPAGGYNNNGMLLGGVTLVDERGNGGSDNRIPFNPDPATQYNGTVNKMGQIDIFNRNFKFPQMLKGNIGFDYTLPYDILFTGDVEFSKTLNNTIYYNMMINPTGKRLSGSGDNREIYEYTTDQNLTKNYTGIYFGDNCNKGYTYNFSAILSKDFHFGLYAYFAYNYGRAKSLSDSQSSQNSSQWIVSNQNGLNNLNLQTSFYDMGSRVLGSVSYKSRYSSRTSTTVTLFYEGKHGMHYSYGVDGNLLGDAPIPTKSGAGAHLMYIPKNANDINLVDYVRSDNSVYTKEQQWNDLDRFISSDKYLSKNRGKVAERYSNFTPWENIFDLKIMQELSLAHSNGKTHRLQISLDIFNLGNLLNKKWGNVYNVYNNTYMLNFEPIKFVGYGGDGTTPLYQVYENKIGATAKSKKVEYPYDNVGKTRTSRWQAQIGIKYIF